MAGRRHHLDGRSSTNRLRVRCSGVCRRAAAFAGGRARFSRLRRCDRWLAAPQQARAPRRPLRWTGAALARSAGTGAGAGFATATWRGCRRLMARRRRRCRRRRNDGRRRGAGDIRRRLLLERAVGGVPASQPACAITRSSIACDSVLLPSSASASPAFCWTHAHADVFSHARASCSAASRSSSRCASSSFRRCTSGRDLLRRRKALQPVARRREVVLLHRAARGQHGIADGHRPVRRPGDFLSMAATGGAAGVTGSEPLCAYPPDFATFASIAPDALCCSRAPRSSSVLSCCRYATPPAISPNAHTAAITRLATSPAFGVGQDVRDRRPSSNSSSALVAALTGAAQSGAGALSDGPATAAADRPPARHAGLNRLSARYGAQAHALSCAPRRTRRRDRRRNSGNCPRSCATCCRNAGRRRRTWMQERSDG